MSPKSLLKKTNNLYNPLDLKRRIDIYYAMQEGIEIKPNVPLLLNPKDLSHIQQNILIEHLKFNEAMLIIEIADYIKLTRQTLIHANYREYFISSEHIQSCNALYPQSCRDLDYKLICNFLDLLGQEV